MRSKRKIHKEIAFNSLDGYHKGYSHRNHRTNKENKIQRTNRISRQKELEKIEEENWLQVKREINLIGR